MKLSQTILSALGLLAAATTAWGTGTPASINAVYPPLININAGAHCSFIVSAAGTTPLSYQWSYNGTPLPGATTSILGLTNLLAANSVSNAGSYSVTVTNLGTTNAGASPAVGNCALEVYSGTFPLASTNLAVLRSSDGVSSTGASTGNALYVDQMTTNGTYVSTLMMPDEANTPNSVPNSEIVANGSTFMNISADGYNLVFYGYHVSRPFSSSVGSAISAVVPRAAGAVSGLGYYALGCTTTSTSYNGQSLNDVASPDGLTAFYFSAGGGGCVLVQPGLPDVQITPASGFGPGAGAGRQNGIYGGSLWYAANASINPGLFTWNGTGANLPTTAGILPFDVVQNPATIATANPNDFVFSPDGQTIYACSGSQTGGSNPGGIQRWDNATPYGLSGWTMTYNLTNMPQFGTTGNNGPDGVVVDFSQWTNGGGPGVWGAGSSNAIVYFTTGQQTNVMSIVDTNSINSTFSNPAATIIATLGPNQQWHGIRFCPSTLAAGITAEPSSIANAVPGSTVTFTVGTVGSQPLIYQWYGPGGPLANGSGISGASSSALSISGVSSANVGSYYVTVSNAPPGIQTSTTVTLAISTSQPAVAIPPTNTSAIYGGVVSFTVVPYGTAPFTYQWNGPSGPINPGPSGNGSTYFVVTNLSGSVTNCVLTVSNVSCADAGSYSVTVGNGNGSITSTNAVLAVQDPVITVQPVSQVAFINSTATFTVTAVGSGTLGYQWLSNGINLSDGGAISGSSSSALTIAPATVQSTATYSVVVTGIGGCNNGQTAASSLVTFTPAFPPQSRTVTAGATVTFVVGGGTNFQWSWDGTNINSATNSFITFSNVQAVSDGTYSVAFNANTLNASATLTVEPGLFTLYPSNLVVLRQGDGAAGLVNTGNIIYLDQYTTNGTYLNTTMVPYNGSTPLLCNSGGTDGYMSRSANNQFLNFPGYCATRPYASAVSSATAAAVPRGVGAVNGLGYFVLAVADTTLYSAFNINDVCSTDGLSNFWTGGNQSTGTGAGIQYVRPGQPDVQITTSTQNPGLGNNKEVNIIAGSLYCTSGSGTVGLYDLGNPPPTNVIGSSLTATALDASPNDFFISPDQQTIYITDGANVNPPGGAGGIERFDMVSGAYQLQYTIPTTTQPGQTGNDGPDGLYVDFSANATWGSGVTGAIIYATTGSATENYLIRIVDTNGAGSAATVLAFGGPNQGLRGIRTGLTTVPVGISQQPTNTTAVGGSTATLTVGATGTLPYGYQWTFDGTNIVGATGSSLVLSNVVSTNAGTYAVTVNNAIPSSQVSSNAVLTVTATPPGPANFTSITPLASGQVQLTFTGSAAGATYHLWTSTNIALTPIATTWTLLSTGTFGSGPVTFTDPGVNNYATRFYVITEP